jgi:Zn finger protein HypA/HybF involved in hydrogenase expression
MVSILAIAAVVYAGEGFSMKCKSKTCGYETEVTFGGGMAYGQLTGYCVKCKKFVTLNWTLEGSPALDPAAKKIPQPKPLGTVRDSQTGKTLTIYACPHCAGPFAEIKSKDDLKHCPSCNKPEFAVDETKPRLAID